MHETVLGQRAEIKMVISAGIYTAVSYSIYSRQYTPELLGNKLLTSVTLTQHALTYPSITSSLTSHTRRQRVDCECEQCSGASLGLQSSLNCFM